jgi:hypothetical protein
MANVARSTFGFPALALFAKNSHFSAGHVSECPPVQLPEVNCPRVKS